LIHFYKRYLVLPSQQLLPPYNLQQSFPELAHTILCYELVSSTSTIGPTVDMSNNKFDALGSDDSEGDEMLNNHNSQPLEVEPGAFTPLPIPDGEHKLQSQYCLWYSRRGPGKQNHNFDQNLKLIGRFGTCEQFWSLYSHMVKPGDLASHSDFHLFKMGIKPMWEDEANKFGGKWIVRLRKGLSSRCWENLVLAMLGEQFMVGEEICGAVVSIRFQEDILSIWNRTACDQAVTNRIRDTFRRVLNLPAGTAIEYKAHNDSIKEHTSVRVKP